MPRLLIAGKVHPAALDLARAAPGVVVDYVEEVSVAVYAPFLATAEAIVIRTQPLGAAEVAAAPRLRMVSRHGVGFDSVDVAALSARGIPLAIVGDVNSRSVAEHAMALLLAAAKRLGPADRATRAGDWVWRNGYDGIELGGKRLLVIGYGRSGRRVAALAAAFGMAVDVHDPFAPPDAVAPPMRAAPDLVAALETADAVTIHAPKGDGPLLGPAEIARMKPGAILVNTARGGIVDEAALVAALRDGRIAAAGIDVFAAEPPPRDHPLADLPNVVLTPHVAGLSRESTERMGVVSVRNALDFFDGRLDPELVVNRAALAAGAAS